MRHFSVAMKADPNCLMAHWGMRIALLSPSTEFEVQANATTQRFSELLKMGEGSRLERGYAYGLICYLEKGSDAAASIFRRVAQEYPNERYPSDLQPEIFAALFSKLGYDSLGIATQDQEIAEASLQKMMERDSTQTLPLHAYLLIVAGASDLTPHLKLARKLCQIEPNYAPYFYLLGHYEWRCGEHVKAAAAFERSVSLYADWMKQNQASPMDCEAWVKAQCYQNIALASKGDFTNALLGAEKIAATSLDLNRPSASGNRAILWEAQTLPARILMHQASPNATIEALKTLPKPNKNQVFYEHSLSHWWTDGLRIYLEAKKSIEEKNFSQATEIIALMNFHGQAMLKKQKQATAWGEQTEWSRSVKTLEMLTAELRAKMALNSSTQNQRSALNWFLAATDRQTPEKTLTPPAILTPMASHVGDFYFSLKAYEKALEAYEKALDYAPNDSKAKNHLEKTKASLSKKNP